MHEAPSFLSQSTIVLEKYNVSPFLHSKAQGTKFDLDEKWVKVNLGSLFDQNLVVISHLMHYVKFQGNQPRGSGDEDFLRFLSNMGIVAIFGMRPRSSEQIFNIPLPECCV